MDACADESLYHFTATVSHRNLNKTVHLWDRIGQGSSGGGGDTQKIFIREGSAPRSNPLSFLTEKVLEIFFIFFSQP